MGSGVCAFCRGPSAGNGGEICSNDCFIAVRDLRASLSAMTKERDLLLNELEATKVVKNFLGEENQKLHADVKLIGVERDAAISCAVKVEANVNNKLSSFANIVRKHAEAQFTMLASGVPGEVILDQVVKALPYLQKIAEADDV